MLKIVSIFKMPKIIFMFDFTNNDITNELKELFITNTSIHFYETNIPYSKGKNFRIAN